MELFVFFCLRFFRQLNKQEKTPTSIFSIPYSTFAMFCPPGRQRDPGKNAREPPWGPSWLPFFRPWPPLAPKVDLWSHFVSVLASFWLPFGPFALHFGYFWVAFAPFCTPRGTPRPPNDHINPSTHQPIDKFTNFPINSLPWPGGMREAIK